jgi:uncharacterized protein DUF11/prealbumin domain-containing protein
VFTRVARRERPRRTTYALVTAGAIASLLVASVALALVSDSGTVSVEVQNSTQSSALTRLGDLGSAYIQYIGKDDPVNGVSGTGLFDPFVRLQGSLATAPTEKGYNTCSQNNPCGGDVTEFETKPGSWTHAIKASAIPQVNCQLDADAELERCWELYNDINEGNNAKHISLTKVEIYFTQNAGGVITDYPWTNTEAQLQYEFNGEIKIHDVNSGSGRGDLLYLVPVQPFTADDWFVLYSEWGSLDTVAGSTETYRSEGGFEEWKVRKAPNLGIVKVAVPAGPVNAGDNIGFDITVSNTGAADATNVQITDNLPASDGSTTGTLDWSMNPAVSGCTINGAAGSEVLSCTFATLASGASITIHLVSDTTAADCGVVSNTAILVGDGSSTATVTVNCAAIRILKNSTKGGAVSNAGAVFAITGPNSYSNSVTDAGTTGAEDEDSDVGEICISGLAPGTYTVNETTPPNGYGGATQTNVSAVATNGTNCTSNQPTGTDVATFTNAPLGEFIINYNDLGSGETSAKIDCTGLTPSPVDSTPTAFDDDTETYTNLPGGDPAIVYTCTISVDP